MRLLVPTRLLPVLFLPTLAQAEVRPARLFGDHMVLQRETEAPIWGTAAPGEVVRVRGTWSDDHESITTADADGRWRTSVPTPEAGGPYRLVIEGTNRIEFEDVLVGEVWIASGQSNMWWPVLWCADGEAEIAAGDHPHLRLFTVPQAYAIEPRTDLEGGSWAACSPETVAWFSATAYYFGRELQTELGVPVGLVHTSWGGTPVEAWTSRPTIERLGEFDGMLERIDAALASEEVQPTLAELQAGWWTNVEEHDPGLRGGWMKASVDEASWTAATVPGTFAEIGLGEFDGCVWYRRAVELDARHAGRDHVLALGPVDDMDLTFFNGEPVGQTREDERWQQPRRYAVPARLVRAGANVITVCAVDSGGVGSIGTAGGVEPGMRLFPEGAEDEAVPLEGPWLARAGASTADLGGFPRSTWFEQHAPTSLHNAMIAPLVPFAARGAIWYQGESNWGRAAQYRRLFPALIADWRGVFERELSFYFVQIAPFAYENDEGQAAEIREAQALALALSGTGMAVTMDVGNPLDIHPVNKQAVGRRLALWALAKDYGRDVVCSGPLYGAMLVVGDEARLSFRGTDGGLGPAEPLTCFTIAGEDRVFHPAQARVVGDVVVVRSDAVPRPVAVRHAWGAADEPNLRNGAGLPAPSFRTDRW